MTTPINGQNSKRFWAWRGHFCIVCQKVGAWPPWPPFRTSLAECGIFIHQILEIEADRFFLAWRRDVRIVAVNVDGIFTRSNGPDAKILTCSRETVFEGGRGW